MMRKYALCLLAVCSVAGAAMPDVQVRLDQTALTDSASFTEQKGTFTELHDSNVTCDIRCNDEDVDSADLNLGVEAKSCVGTLTIFCKSNETDSIFGAKCEGKSTMLADAKTISICEGSFQRFGKRSLKTEAGRAKLVQAFGCLGTAIAVSPNKSANTDMVQALMVDGLKQEDLDAIANSIASEESSREGRCNGFSGRFVGAKLGGSCNKHTGKGARHADRDADKGKDARHADRDADRDADRPIQSFDAASQDLAAAQLALPGARRSLFEHHDHHNKHDDKKHSGKGKLGHKDGKHGSKHGEWKHWKAVDMTFDDLQGNVQQNMQKAGVELLPHDIPSGSFSSRPKCSITCNGRPTWFGALFPCLGKLEIDCDIKSSELASMAIGGSMEVAGPPRDIAVQASCKGFWSGDLFKTCSGFSDTHFKVDNDNAWDFCSGKKAVRVGGRPGKSSFAGSWCKGQNLVVIDKEEDDM